MIECRKDYLFYLEEDKNALGMDKKRLITLAVCRSEKDYILKYERLLRKTEYIKNCLKGKNFIWNVYFKLLTYRLLQQKIKLGFDIPPNVFGPGLNIVHIGPIIVNGYAKVGANCTLYPMTNIGNDGITSGSGCSATIGENCFISSGVKIIGSVSIASHVTLGAGAVVVKDILESNTTWGGIPAKKISSRSIK